MQKKKKGFTLVELLVVIAILAILASVSVVGYLSFTNKAKESNDISLTKQLNDILIAEEQLSKPQTASEAIKLLKNNGYDFEKIKTSSKDYTYVWDAKENKVILLNEKYEQVSPTNFKDINLTDTFAFVSNVEELNFWVEKGYGVYLKEEFNDSIPRNVDYSLDLGLKVGNINFVTEKSGKYIIAGNNSLLTIDAKNASINHYGNVKRVTIKSTDLNNSYHEYGSVSHNITLTYGHLVIENTAKIKNVVINAIDHNDVKLDVSNSVSDVNVTATNKTVLDNLDIIIKSGNVNKFDVPTNFEGSNYFGGGMGTKDSPYLLKNENHFLNISKANKFTNCYYSLCNDVRISASNKGNAHNYIFKNFKDSYFDGNNHTIEVSTPDTCLFSQFTRSTIKNLNLVNFYSVIYDAKYNTNIESVNVYGNRTIIGGNEGNYIIYALPDVNTLSNGSIAVVGEFNFKNCNSYVNLNGDGTSGNYNSVFVGYAKYYTNYSKNNFTFNFEKCNNYGNVILGKASMFLGNIPSETCYVNIKSTNCKNYGVIKSIFNGEYKKSDFVSMNADFNTTITCDGITKKNTETLFDKFNVPCEDTGKILYGAKDDNFTINVSENNYFTITKSSNLNVEYYIISSSIYTTLNDNNGSLIVYANEKISSREFTGNNATSKYLKNLQFVDSLWVQKNKDGLTTNNIDAEFPLIIYTKDNVSYIDINSKESNLGGIPKNPYSISVSAFSKDGSLLDMVVYNLR